MDWNLNHLLTKPKIALSMLDEIFIFLWIIVLVAIVLTLLYGVFCLAIWSSNRKRRKRRERIDRQGG